MGEAMVGRTIGKYRVIEKIGEGGMGEVYLAEDTRLNRPVVLKAISSRYLGQEDAGERFLREARATSAINHPGIATVFDFLESDDGQLLCMEYVEGQTIQERAQEGPIPAPEAARILVECADALSAAHQKGIVHRDIKSANIMVRPDGRAKIMDFGLAYLEQKIRLTKTGTTLGTLSYTPPESITGRPVDQCSDIFSLGVVAYEMLSGSLPFTGRNDAEIVNAILAHDPPPLTEVVEDVPEPLARIVARMLEKEPARRFATCGELAESLRLVMALYESDRLPKRLVKLLREKRRWSTVSVGATILAVGLFFALGGLPDVGSRAMAEDRVLVASFENRTGDAGMNALGSYLASTVAESVQRAQVATAVPFEAILEQTEVMRSGLGLGAGVMTLANLARKLQAGTAVTGAIYLLDPTTLEVKLEVRDMRQDETIASLEPVRGTPADAAALAGLISRRVVAALAVQFDADLEGLTEEAGQPPSQEAFQLLSSGLVVYFTRSGSERYAAIDYFAEATRLDPSYMSAQLWLARTYNHQGSIAKVDSVLRLVERSGEELLPLEWHRFNWLQANLDRDLERMFFEARAAAALSPGSFWSYEASQAARFSNRPRIALQLADEVDPEARLLQNYPFFIGFQTGLRNILGRHKEALAFIQEARRRLPEDLGLIRQELSALAILGRHGEAAELIDEALALPEQTRSRGFLLLRAAEYARSYGDPESGRLFAEEALSWFLARPESDQAELTHRELFAYALFFLDRWEEARAAYRELLVETPEEVWTIGYLGMLEAALGNEARAEELLALLGDEHSPTYRCVAGAQILGYLGRKQEAVDRLQEGYRQMAWVYGMLPYRPWEYDPLRGFPAFEEFYRPKG